MPKVRVTLALKPKFPYGRWKLHITGPARKGDIYPYDRRTFCYKDASDNHLGGFVRFHEDEAEVIVNESDVCITCLRAYARYCRRYGYPPVYLDEVNPSPQGSDTNERPG